jgi:quercetin dioxygenase-like cupin family protein
MADLIDPTNRTGRLLHGTVEAFNLAKEIEFVQAEPEYANNGHNALTLSKNDALRNVLICLKKGAGLHEHNAPGPFSLFVVKGKIQFVINSLGEEETKTIELNEGQLLVLGEPQKHEVNALEESSILLAIVKE